MKKLVATAMAGILAVTMAACGASEESTGETNTSDKVLTMGTSADYFPFEYIDTAKGDEIVGFDVAIAKEVTKNLGYDLKIEDMEFGSLLGALSSGRVDFVMAGMTPTDERKKNADFTDIYFESKNLVMTKDKAITADDELKGKKVGVQLGSIQEALAKDRYKDSEAVSLNKIPEIIQELNTGRIDALIIEDAVAVKYMDQDESLKTYEIKEDGPTGSAVAFKKGDKMRDEFNAELKKMIDNGDIDKLAEEWFQKEAK
ncbi:ABC transporter substrate-binding protein [Exiguobacterium sp. RIT452]|jgi:polar amino acid transport system substrate-binding protein|uniref:ABC transporter substrate-binding protein n=1 Tax=Exiguobacterium undae TaxID=169177 RepID=A0ABX2VCQ1_9BACL|nr:MULTISPECIES: transporter substrate-binding domain-containing protein [Exiguobacterium]OAN16010.1 ABC transporter substrate-binding protein [Exiguobacterium undae]RJP02024.1 ABC transporter substrate-binding protein [Exiguobacterium sp. RIT452]